ARFGRRRLSSAAAPFWQYRPALLPGQRQERTLPRGLRILFAVEALLRADRQVPDVVAGAIAGRRPRRRRAPVEDILYRDQRPGAERTRDAGHRNGRAANQAGN